MTLARPALPGIESRTPYPDDGPGMYPTAPSRADQRGPWPHGGPNATQFQRYPSRWVPPAPVFDAYRFSNWIPLTFQLAVTPDTIVVARPDIYRTVLLLSCPSGSPGSLLIAFDGPATAASALFTLPPGAVILLDFNVPQNEIHAAGTAANTIGNFAYANVPFTPGA